jgi:asparagine synthase (glutamine-hydrolysing)
MCGILGGISVQPVAWLGSSDRLSRAVDCLAHRGPDDRGEFIVADHRAFLGHRRLSIIDLAGGHQPIADEQGARHLCYNGEIYNYRSLHANLLARGHSFRTRVDGEVALHLYEEDRDGFVEPLEGMFAIAILDEPEGHLTLARDRNGIKPLYYYHDGESLLFGSELKAILSLLSETPAVSPHALRQFLRWKYIPAPLTIFEGIRKLPPGHILKACRSGDGCRVDVDVRSYWAPDYSGEKLTDEREAVERLDEKLRASVESHLESDVEVGALLSGGVDSSLVVAMATAISKQRIKTFSVGFEEAGFDQLPFARVLAKKCRTEHIEEHVRLDPMTAVPALVRQFDEPFADSSALACYRVCQVAGEHVKVVLTGDGGDESFAGYGRYEEVLHAATPPGIGRRLLNRSILASSGALFSPEAKYLKRFRAALHAPLERHEEHLVMCSPWLTRRLLTEAYSTAGEGPEVFDQYRREAAARGWAPIDVAQFVDLRMYLPDDILTKVDRTSMACSLECRVPLLDHSITEFSARLAPELKIRGGVRKYLLKRLAERYVPHELIYRPKMGFRVPIRRWFKRGLLGETAELLLDGILVSQGILDPRGLRWVFRNQKRPWIDLASHLWALLCLEHWARAYLR